MGDSNSLRYGKDVNTSTQGQLEREGMWDWFLTAILVQAKEKWVQTNYYKVYSL